MQKINKTIAIMIALFLIISTASSIALQQPASAHTPVWQIATWAYMNVAPQPNRCRPDRFGCNVVARPHGWRSIN
jgi:hypothetical protein